MAATPQPDATGRPLRAIIRSLRADSYETGEAWFAFSPGDAGPDLPLHVRLAQQPTGRFVCTGLVVGDFDLPDGAEPREINAAALRSIRMPQLIRAALDHDNAPAEGDTDADRLRKAALEFTVADIPAVGPRPGRGGYPPEHFQRVAAAYRKALATEPHRPTAFFAEQSGKPESTVRRWLARARKDGYLTAEETDR